MRTIPKDADPKDFEQSKSSNCRSGFAGREPDAVLTVLNDWLVLMKLRNCLQVKVTGEASRSLTVGCRVVELGNEKLVMQTRERVPLALLTRLSTCACCTTTIFVYLSRDLDGSCDCRLLQPKSTCPSFFEDLADALGVLASAKLNLILSYLLAQIFSPSDFAANSKHASAPHVVQE